MMFTMAVKLKLVSHHVFDICEDSLDETEEALAEERSWPIGSVVFSWLCDVHTPASPPAPCLCIYLDSPVPTATRTRTRT
jgi:hypothetical protein